MANIKKKERKRKKLWCSHTGLELIFSISLVVVKSNWLHYTQIVTWSLTVTGYLSRSVVLIRPLSGWGLAPVYTDGRRHSLSECSRAGRGTLKSSLMELDYSIPSHLEGVGTNVIWPPLCVDLHPSFSVSCYLSVSASLSPVFPSGVCWLALNMWAECQFDEYTQQGHWTALGPNELAAMIMQSLGKPLNPCSWKCAAQHTVRAMDMFEPVRHQNFNTAPVWTVILS